MLHPTAQPALETSRYGAWPGVTAGQARRLRTPPSFAVSSEVWYCTKVLLADGCCDQGQLHAIGHVSAETALSKTRQSRVPGTVTDVGLVCGTLGCSSLSACYSLSPVTTALTYTTTEDGFAVMITTASVITLTRTDLSAATANGGVAKFCPSTASKAEATTAAAALSSGGGGSGLWCPRRRRSMRSTMTP